MNWQSNKHLHTFHGGIHPPENKDQSTQSPIEVALLPDKLILPLQQHIGQQAKPLVQVGERVLKGQMIAEPTGYVSAAVHAPTSGTITAIKPHALPHPSGLSELCIIIDPDGKDEWTELSSVADYQQLDTQQLLQHIREAGITGLGGAGFPTSVKLNPSTDLTIDTLILNAAECEPYITADDMLIRERAEEVVQGLQIMAHILQPEKCLIGIETNKPQAIEALRHAIESLQLSELIVVERIPVKYPSGGEKQLIQILTGKEVPNGGIPADIGMVCHNVGTAAAVYRAIAKGEPLISRITTITGDAVSRQGNIEVLLGTPIESLLAHFEIKQDKLHRLIMGGPMMGFTLDDISLPVVKASNCILAATRKELPDPAPEQACIRCGMCAEACPATLLPQQLYWFSKSREFDKALSHNLLDCIECGACSYVCPSNIPLVQYYRFAKGEIRIEEHERTSSDHARQRFEARTARLEQEEAEKEAKRQARSEAAAASKKTKETTDVTGDKKPVDPKAAVVQAALERAKARKAQKAADAKGDTDAPAIEQAKDAAPAMSAVERAKARKAARAAEQDGDDTATVKDQEKAAGLSALEKAKAKRAKDSGAEKTESKGLSALERAKAKRASGNDDQPAKADTDSISQTESKPAKAISALEKAKAKRAEAAQTGTPAKADNNKTASTGHNEEKTLSALERAKLKRVQIVTQSSDKTAEDKTTDHADEKPLSALERAKIKRAEAAKDVEKEATAPTESVEEKPAVPMSALERAKAKRAEKAAQQAADGSTADTETRD